MATARSSDGVRARTLALVLKVDGLLYLRGVGQLGCQTGSATRLEDAKRHSVLKPHATMTRMTCVSK